MFPALGLELAVLRGCLAPRVPCGWDGVLGQQGADASEHTSPCVDSRTHRSPHVTASISTKVNVRPCRSLHSTAAPWARSGPAPCFPRTSSVPVTDLLHSRRQYSGFRVATCASWGTLVQVLFLFSSDSGAGAAPRSQGQPVPAHLDIVSQRPEVQLQPGGRPAQPGPGALQLLQIRGGPSECGPEPARQRAGEAPPSPRPPWVPLEDTVLSLGWGLWEDRGGPEGHWRSLCRNVAGPGERAPDLRHLGLIHQPVVCKSRSVPSRGTVTAPAAAVKCWLCFWGHTLSLGVRHLPRHGGVGPRTLRFAGVVLYSEVTGPVKCAAQAEVPPAPSPGSLGCVPHRPACGCPELAPRTQRAPCPCSRASSPVWCARGPC